MRGSGLGPGAGVVCGGAQARVGQAAPGSPGSPQVCAQLPTCWGWPRHGPGSAKPSPSPWAVRVPTCPP